MLKELVKIANELDSKGLVKQADLVDKAISKRALWDDYYGQPEDYRSNTAEEMMEDFNKRLSRGEQEKFVQMFARVIDGWEEFKKKRLGKDREAYEEFDIDELEHYYGEEDKRKLMNLYWMIPNEDKKTALLVYERIARITKIEDKYDTSLDPKSIDENDSSVETRILKDLVNQKGATEQEISYAYKEIYESFLEKKEQADKLSNPDELSSMSNDEFINIFSPMEDLSTNREDFIKYYRELVKRHKAGGIIDPDSQNEIVVNPEDIMPKDNSRRHLEEQYIIESILEDSSITKEELQAIYNQT